MDLHHFNVNLDQRPVLWIRNDFFRIWIRLFQIQNNAFHLNADPSPAPHKNDANLGPLVSKPSSTPFCVSTCTASAATFRTSKASLNFDCYADPIQLFTNKCVSGSSFRNTGIRSQLRLCEFTFLIPIIPLTSFVSRCNGHQQDSYPTFFCSEEKKAKNLSSPIRKNTREQKVPT